MRPLRGSALGLALLVLASAAPGLRAAEPSDGERGPPVSQVASIFGEPVAHSVLASAAGLRAAEPSDGESGDAAASRPPAAELARRPDERRPPVSHVLSIFGEPVEFSGEYELTLESRRNLNLDKARARDREQVEQEIKLEAMFSPMERSTVFVQLVGKSEIETRRQHGAEQNRGALERGQTWLYLDRPADLPLALQFGRISLVEQRSWWWDDDLDAARVIVGGADWRIESGLAQRLMPVSTDERGIDPQAEDLARWFGRASWSWRKRHWLEAYWLLARDRSGQPAQGTLLAQTRADPVDAHFNWFGFRLVGEERTSARHRLGYWLDVAWLSGSEKRSELLAVDGDRLLVGGETRQRVSAAAWDIGASWSLPGKARPTLWAAWAVGSGDGDDDDGTDHNFRQTGLEENKGRVGGVKHFRYYGELMRPTLSNLAIRSLGASLRFLDKSSLDLVFHDYRQREASERLADSRIGIDPTGVSRALGQEIDLFLAFRESPRAEFILSLATFRAGSAFGPRSGERAWHIEFGVTINF